jgi:uncharacterized membrane protein
MAVLGYGTNVTLQWANGVSDKCALFAVKNVNTGDTINISQEFLVVILVAYLGITPGQILEAPTASGTTVTMPAGLVSAAGYILVYGQSA